jgi:hypothetical protein
LSRFVVAVDAGRCSVCRYAISKGDEVRVEGPDWKHERCAQDLDDGHLVKWHTADSIDRIERAEQEERRIAPLAKQGKCPLCFIELPATGICDEHGSPS